MTAANDTIIAQATAPGRGGVGIIRISGKQASQVAQHITRRSLQARHAHYLTFWDACGEKIDQGIALFFPGPHSFTGEDVLELQGHGGPAVMQMLLKAILTLPDVRMAHPGEFSERAFLNDKIDLVQAEAIADLIEANSESAAKSALASLQGEFSKQVEQLVEALIQLRMYVEAAIDFPEEEIDFLSDGKVAGDLEQICLQLDRVYQSAQRGAILREGMKIVIVGRPNAGKSSLLNALSGKDTAIVTDIAGTTRDVLTEHIHLEGMPLHIIDTAGLRHAKDQVEKIGIERAWREVQQADRILFIHDATASSAQTLTDFEAELACYEPISDWPKNVGITLIRNKIDSTGETAGIDESDEHPLIRLSAKSGQGMDLLREHLKASIGFDNNTEGHYMARQRHLDALAQAQQHLATGKQQLEDWLAGEILAEELRLAQQSLDQISGQFHSDELLGRIFSSFCIGK